MSARETINYYLECLDDFYDTLDDYGNEEYCHGSLIDPSSEQERLDFLKEEVRCLDDCLNFVNLELIPLPQGDVERLREIARSILHHHDYLELSRYEYSKIVSSKTKEYSEMSVLEKNTFYIFLYLFPGEIESTDLLIEYYTIELLLKCSVSPEDLEPIIYKHFKNILDQYAVN